MYNNVEQLVSRILGRVEFYKFLIDNSITHLIPRTAGHNGSNFVPKFHLNIHTT